MRFNSNSKDKILIISTYFVKNSLLAFFNGCHKLYAKKTRRDISTVSISTKFHIIIIDGYLLFSVVILENVDKAWVKVKSKSDNVAG